MTRSISSDGRKAGLGCWGSTALLIACLGLSAGCTTFGQPDLDFSRVEGLRGSSGYTEPVRSTDNELEPFAITNKGLAIERSLGVQ